MKEIKNKKRIVIAVIISIMVLVVILCAIVLKHSNSMINKFKSNLENNNISNLHDIYVSTENYNEKKELNKIFEKKLNSILDEYIKNINDYDKTLELINNYEDSNILTSLIEKTKENLEKIKNSKEEFSKGQDYEENGDIVNAILSYSKVSELDEINYKEAQKYINKNKENIKNDILLEVDELIYKEDYITAKQKLNDLLLISSDNNIQKKLDEIEDKAKEQEIKKYMSEQEIIVESAEKFKEWYSDTISGVKVIVKNNTEKVVKNYVVGILAYDKNGYPLKIEYNNYVSSCKFDGANIQPGQTYGQEKYCNIIYENEKIESALACVEKAEYYDGSTWENPYYEYWLNQYKEKPLQ